MHPLSVRSLDIAFDPGRPALATLELAGGACISGIRIWRTARGPRVVLPSSGQTRGGVVVGVPPSLRRDWTETILSAWRARSADVTKSVRRAA